MKFSPLVLVAFSFSSVGYAEPTPGTSKNALALGDEVGQTGGVAGDMANWLEVIGPKISRSMRLPREFRENGPWGDFVVTVKLVVSPEGVVTHAQVDDSSGEPRVDEYALQAVRATKLIPFTSDMGNNELAFALPINIKNYRPTVADQP